MKELAEIDYNVLTFFNGSDSLFIDNLAVTLTAGLTWVPLYVALLYVVIKNSDTMKQVALVLGCVCLCLILSDGVADFLAKPLVGRYRPSQDPFVKYSIDVVNDMRNTKYGFFSAHASNTFCIAMFFSLLVRNKMFVTGMVLWSLVNCWTRMYLGLHYPGDIIVGLLWGGLVGSLVYCVYIKSYLRMYPDFNYISSQYTSTGYNRADVNVVMLVLTLTLLFAIMKALVY